MAGSALRMEPYIGVVVAWDRGDPVRGAEMAEPFRGKDEFLRQPEIDEIAGHRDVVWLPLDEVACEHVENIPAMHELPPAMPIDVAEHALAEEVAPAGVRHRAQMNV